MPKISQAQGPSYEEGREPTVENGVVNAEPQERPGEHGEFFRKQREEDAEWDGNSSQTSTENNEQTGMQNDENDPSHARSADGLSKRDQETQEDDESSTAQQVTGKRGLKRVNKR